MGLHLNLNENGAKSCTCPKSTLMYSSEDYRLSRNQARKSLSHWALPRLGQVLALILYCQLFVSWPSEKKAFNTLLNVTSNSTGYDCGIYVIYFTEELCENYLANKETSLSDTVTAENIQQKRRALKKLILDLGETKTWIMEVLLSIESTLVHLLSRLF